MFFALSEIRLVGLRGARNLSHPLLIRPFRADQSEIFSLRGGGFPRCLAPYLMGVEVNLYQAAARPHHIRTLYSCLRGFGAGFRLNQVEIDLTNENATHDVRQAASLS
ncbi:MAG: hypothetical protein AB7U82_16285 [Blastocatellales bacterium]